MRIGELARRTAVSERSLRYYEKLGLLSAERTPGGHRDFPATAVDRVICIQQLFAAGLCGSKIGELLPCLPGATPGAKPSPALVEELLTERARIDRMMRDLAHSRDVLDEVIGETREVVVEPREPKG
ncbi:MerR family transcriptional regulator [Streptomyces zagrosensis]|uniref:DNA-binding transcriptional MerR regulator n=1 Tax=Streptomyces zagrosensis TaxID=1042984 RepID=A0A7W9UZB5_9ACTN|nr:MerR family transcriptional regulator [Streptomyces zagrosensis]MBB5936226.1 DNA-binding transcriptional MerR regulator [Streptomyces zagrosensis]